jgi:hypothetical protein
MRAPRNRRCSRKATEALNGGALGKAEPRRANSSAYTIGRLLGQSLIPLSELKSIRERADLINGFGIDKMNETHPVLCVRFIQLRNRPLQGFRLRLISKMRLLSTISSNEIGLMELQQTCCRRCWLDNARLNSCAVHCLSGLFLRRSKASRSSARHQEYLAYLDLQWHRYRDTTTAAAMDAMGNGATGEPFGNSIRVEA